MKYSVIIPICNEEDALVPLVDSLKAVMDQFQEPYEIIFVDDGSTDASVQRLKEIHPYNDKLVIIALTEWVGKAEAMQAGFDHARGEILINLDGDGQDDPGEIPKLLDKMQEGYDVVYGWRRKRQDSSYRKIPSKVSNWIRRLVTGEKVHDVGCALRVFRKKDIQQVCLSKGLHRFLSTIMVKLGYTVGEVEVNHFHRETGVSKYGIRNRLGEGMVDLMRICFLDIHTLMNHQSKYHIQEVLRKSS